MVPTFGGMIIRLRIIPPIYPPLCPSIALTTWIKCHFQANDITRLGDATNFIELSLNMETSNDALLFQCQETRYSSTSWMDRHMYGFMWLFFTMKYWISKRNYMKSHFVGRWGVLTTYSNILWFHHCSCKVTFLQRLIPLLSLLLLLMNNFDC